MKPLSAFSDCGCADVAVPAAAANRKHLTLGLCLVGGGSFFGRGRGR